MTPSDKQKYKAQVAGLAGQVGGVKSMFAGPIPPAPPMPPGSPILIQPSLAPLQAGLKMQAEVIEKLIKLVGEIVESS